jgi:hypothetical protein
MLKRNHSQPEGFNEGELEGFFMIAKSDAALAITQKLTGSQLRLWVYLMMIDPFADHTSDGEPIYRKIPSPAEIAPKIGVTARTIEKDLNLLRDLELYDHKVVEWWGHNKSAKKAKEASQRLKHKQGKGGYLTGETFKQPECVLNNLNDENLAEIPAKKSSGIYIDRARDQTCSDSSQTCSDISPLTPLEKGESEQGASEVEVKSIEPITPSLANMNKTQESTQEPEAYPETKCSAAPKENDFHYQGAEFPKNIDGSDRFPWDTNKRGVFDTNFEQHMTRVLSQYESYQKYTPGVLLKETRKYISRGRFDPERREKLLIEWDAHLLPEFIDMVREPGNEPERPGFKERFAQAQTVKMVEGDWFRDEAGQIRVRLFGGKLVSQTQFFSLPVEKPKELLSEQEAREAHNQIVALKAQALARIQAAKVKASAATKPELQPTAPTVGNVVQFGRKSKQQIQSELEEIQEFLVLSPGDTSVQGRARKFVEQNSDRYIGIEENGLIVRIEEPEF